MPPVLGGVARYGRQLRAVGAVMVGFLLWPLMAFVLFFMIVSTAMVGHARDSEKSPETRLMSGNWPGASFESSCIGI